MPDNPKLIRLSLLLKNEEERKLIKVRAAQAGKTVTRYLMMCSDFYEKNKK